ncbi:MAG: hypothetical protein KatS3mg096_567 [Candidatus Parcubacteria bacterium]|nr:MAG: hypothetical protein KatS3mg095_0953 [Candidatus Parcubacteria bacterium]GIW67699.1 MAG: hypothetical protein KatS3mg096_567 [Candidatus Parcubacteria bacterium]
MVSTKNINTEKLRTKILVIEILREIFNDPDFGLKLKPEIVRKLKKKPKKLIPLEEIRKFVYGK